MILKAVTKTHSASHTSKDTFSKPYIYETLLVMHGILQRKLLFNKIHDDDTLMVDHASNNRKGRFVGVVQM